MLAPRELTAELDDVVPAQVRRRVAHRDRPHRAAAREPGRSSEIQRETLDRDLGQRDRKVDADTDAEVRRIDDHVRIEADVQAVEAEPRFVYELRAEDVRLVDRQDL